MTTTEAATYVDPETRMANLETELHARIEQLERDVSTANLRHTSDIELISDAAIEAAEENSFCGTYDNLVSELNKMLNVKLRERTSRRMFRVSFNVELDTRHDQLADVTDALSDFFRSATLDRRIDDELASCGYDNTNPDSGSSNVEID